MAQVPTGAVVVKQELKVPVDEAWKLLGDWSKGECFQHYGQVKVEIVEGLNNTPNCVRAMSAPKPDGSIMRVREKLLTIDEKNHSFTYKCEENGFGFSFLEGSFKLTDAGDGTSVVDWSNKYGSPDASAMGIAVPLFTNMYVETVKLAEKIYLDSKA